VFFLVSGQVLEGPARDLRDPEAGGGAHQVLRVQETQPDGGQQRSQVKFNQHQYFIAHQTSNTGWTFQPESV
jgi:hypothetical protein